MGEASRAARGIVLGLPPRGPRDLNGIKNGGLFPSRPCEVAEGASLEKLGLAIGGAATRCLSPEAGGLLAEEREEEEDEMEEI